MELPKFETIKIQIGKELPFLFLDMAPLPLKSIVNSNTDLVGVCLSPTKYTKITVIVYLKLYS